MIGPPSNTRIWIVAAGHTDMGRGSTPWRPWRRPRAANPFCGHVFVFRGRRGDILKVLWFDGQGLLVLAKRLERGSFVWPQGHLGQRLAHAGAVVDASGGDRLAYADANAHSPELAA